jgi:hypothetical protein
MAGAAALADFMCKGGSDTKARREVSGARMPIPMVWRASAVDLFG